MNHLDEKTLSSEVKFSGKILDVKQDIVELENNSTAIRDVVVHHGGVCVLPITDDDEVLLVEQFRYPHNKITLEIPAGKLEQNESHYDCGLRELAEETGHSSAEYSYLGLLFPTPAYCTEVIHMYTAKKLVALESQKLDDDEFLDIRRIKFQKAVQMVLDNEIEDAKTQIALLREFAQRQRGL